MRCNTEFEDLCMAAYLESEERKSIKQSEPVRFPNEAERERLAILAEECGEVIQAIGKILRHGFENSFSSDSMVITETNRQRLRREICDVLAVTGLLQQEGDINIVDLDKTEMLQIAKNKNKWLRFNKFSITQNENN